ncbi:MAG: hypothetical protein ABIU63_17180 [Chitinophagaceae bacterium]
MNRITQNIIAVIVFLLSYSFCFSQTGVSVKASINRDKIMIGEAIELKLEASVPAGMTAVWFPVDSIAHFEFIDKGKIDSSGTSDTRTYRQTLIITSFDSGRWALPSFPLAIGNREYITDSLPVSVAYSNFDPKQEYHDIKEIIEVENTSTRYIPWVLLALTLLSLGAVVYFLRQKVTRPLAPVVKKSLSKLSPLQEAMQALDGLHPADYSEQAQAKVFHTALNDILRTYLYRKTGIATMEKTSGELMLQLKAFNLPTPDFTLLAQVLRMNDAVKFAKYQPATNDNVQALATIKKSVQQFDTIIP